MSILLNFPLLTYALRTILASAALFSYYRVFLYNKRFHQANRVFLLGAATLSLLIPLVPLSLHFPWNLGADPALSAITLSPVTHAPAPAITPPLPDQNLFRILPLIAVLVYCVVTTFLLARLIISVYRIVRAARKYPSTSIGNIRFLNSHEPGAPFSFFHWLFWDHRIDPNEDKGRLIFLHESYHIRERHTLDILGLECIRCLCWFNPFIHLICREIRTVHEFLADHNAVEGYDRHMYAELLVWQAAARPAPFLQHPFFHSSINRRINMIIQLRTRRTNPLGRLMALPLLALLLTAAAAAPAQDSNPSAPAQISASPSDTARLLKLYCKNLRYPAQVASSGKEGTIYFSMRLDELGGIKDFNPLDAPPPGQKLLKITVVAYAPANPQHPAQPLTKEETQKFLLDEARRVSGQISQQLAATGTPLPPGEYYLEITFSLQ